MLLQVNKQPPKTLPMPYPALPLMDGNYITLNIVLLDLEPEWPEAENVKFCMVIDCLRL